MALRRFLFRLCTGYKPCDCFDEPKNIGCARKKPNTVCLKEYARCRKLQQCRLKDNSPEISKLNNTITQPTIKQYDSSTVTKQAKLTDFKPSSPPKKPAPPSVAKGKDSQKAFPGKQKSSKVEVKVSLPPKKAQGPSSPSKKPATPQVVLKRTPASKNSEKPASSSISSKAAPPPKRSASSPSVSDAKTIDKKPSATAKRTAPPEKPTSPPKTVTSKPTAKKPSATTKPTSSPPKKLASFPSVAGSKPTAQKPAATAKPTTPPHKPTSPPKTTSTKPTEKKSATTSKPTTPPKKSASSPSLPGSKSTTQKSTTTAKSSSPAPKPTLPPKASTTKPTDKKPAATAKPTTPPKKSASSPSEKGSKTTAKKFATTAKPTSPPKTSSAKPTEKKPVATAKPTEAIKKSASSPSVGDSKSTTKKPVAKPISPPKATSTKPTDKKSPATEKPSTPPKKSVSSPNVPDSKPIDKKPAVTEKSTSSSQTPTSPLKAVFSKLIEKKPAAATTKSTTPPQKPTLTRKAESLKPTAEKPSATGKHTTPSPQPTKPLVSPFNQRRIVKRSPPKDKKVRVKKSDATKSAIFVGQPRKLFTPGPLMITDRVKSAMMLDIAKRHVDFAYINQFIRSALLQIARVNEDDYTTIPIEGNSSFLTEATLRTMIGNNSDRTILILSNGNYGDRVAQICDTSGVKNSLIPMSTQALSESLSSKKVHGVFAVHCETSTGKINPVSEMGKIVKEHSADTMYFVDAVASFGSVPFDSTHVDFLLSTSGKSLHSTPGVAFLIGKREMIEKNRQKGVSVVMDLGSQFDELERSGNFRFNPPNNVMLAFKEALLEYSDQGSIEGRAERYIKNNSTLKQGMEKMGFKRIFTDEDNPQGYMMTVFEYPRNPLFVFPEFYNRLSDAGFVIASQNTTVDHHFGIANMGNLDEKDVENLIESIRQVCTDMRIEIPLYDTYF